MAHGHTLTTIGATKIAAALLPGGTPVLITHMAVGDGDGAPINPLGLEDLVNEVYRTTLNQSFLLGSQPVYQMIIAGSVGGFTVREISLIDIDGDVIAIGSHPVIEKPLPGPGAGAAGELTLHMVLEVSHAAAVELVVPPSAIATQAWVGANFSIAALQPGGTTDQVWTKLSNAPGDAGWRDPGELSLIVDIVEEEVELDADQVIIDLLVCTTQGTAYFLYQDGGATCTRLRPSQVTVNTATQIEIDPPAAIVAGDILYAVQNEPASQYKGVPIGAYVFLALTDNPVNIYGYGEWERRSQGRVLVGLKETDPDFDVIGETGGAKVHQHTGVTAAGGNHNHGGMSGNTALTVDQIPAHRHQVVAGGNSNVAPTADKSVSSGYSPDNKYAYGLRGLAAEPDIGRTSLTGAGQPHGHALSASGTHTHTVSTDDGSSLMPYEVVAIWQRVA